MKLQCNARSGEYGRGTEKDYNEVASQLRQKYAHAASNSEQSHGPRQNSVGAHLGDVSRDGGNFSTSLAGLQRSCGVLRTAELLLSEYTE